MESYAMRNGLSTGWQGRTVGDMAEISELGKLILERREKLGMKQAEFARYAEVPASTINRLEKGVNALPRALYRRRLAKALGIPHVEIFVLAGELESDEVPSAGIPSPVFPSDDARSDIVDLMRDVDPVPGAGTLKSVKRLLEVEVIDQAQMKERKI